MNKTTIILFILLSINSAFSQVQQNTHQLNSIENLLTVDVKEILDEKLKNKKVVFLGESNHYFGSELLAKTEFVKYLVLEKGYKDIVFEGDFFALYFDHSKRNLYPFWSNSVQGKELFEFLEKNNVTIWGLDNQLNSTYTYTDFTNKLNGFLKENSIDIDQKFIELTDTFFKNTDRSNSEKIMGKSNLQYLISEIDNLLEKDNVTQNKLWTRFLESYKSYIKINSTDKTSEKGTPIRDKQMARNLDFIVDSMPEKKFIVWLHNAHMAKYEPIFVKGETMGGQFVEAHPNSSYHIAFSSINMPYRKSKRIKKYSRDEENLLHFLPSTENNYFINSQQIIIDNPEFREKEYDGMFYILDDKERSNWFNHYDALIFISKGEYV